MIYLGTEDKVRVNPEELPREQLRRSWQIQNVLYDLVRLLLEDMSLEEALKKVILTVTSVPWLALESKGGVFLVEEDPSVLVLKAHRNLPLPLPLKSMCARVPFGRCLCGRAALSGKVEFADRVDERHENEWQGMREHGHYCIPIMSKDKAMGVLYLHLKEGHLRNEEEEEFLCAAADLLTGIISRKKLEEELTERNVALQRKVQELTGLNSLFQKHLGMHQERDAAYQKLVKDIHTLAEEASQLLQEVPRV